MRQRTFVQSFVNRDEKLTAMEGVLGQMIFICEV